MMKYEYRLLAYIHDTVRKERVNVAILFHSPDAKMVRFGARGELRTLKAVFPDLVVPDLRSYLQNIQKTFDLYHKRYSGELPIHPDINKFCLQILPEDASSMQWIGTGSGITDDLDATFERLLHKLVTQKTGSGSEANRPDAAVWSVFSRELKKRNMLDLFKPIELNISGFKEEIKYTYQNGALHCLKPISLDLSNSENMLDKVYKTRGWHETIQQSNPDRALRFYYLIGKPLRADLIESYNNACELLKRDDSAIVITEDHADELPRHLESAVSSHH